MSKKKRPFPGEDAPRGFQDSAQRTIYEGEAVGGVFGFFRDYGVRETIESILVAVVLALMFRAYEAEAFIIPTGSMAPALQGQHMDVHCEKCGFEFEAGASQESSTSSVQNTVEYVHCPICRYKMRMRRNQEADHNSCSGDRILVNKFIYDFSTPKRWDVIVFKNPNNAKQNYIKRLIGLPDENLLIDYGDIYTMEPDGNGGFKDKQIVRKPPEKVKAMLQLVDDSDYVAKELRAVHWPSRWQQWSDKTTGSGWEVTESDNKSRYYLKQADNTYWLRYRHLHPFESDWDAIDKGELPAHIKQNQDGNLISDYYCYNDQEYEHVSAMHQRPTGAHWVGDLAIEGWFDVQSDSGSFMLDLVEGGAHFVCTIDVATGQAKLSCEDPSVKFVDGKGQPVANPTAKTSLKGAGNYHVMMANVDRKIFLWINNRYVEFDAPAYDRTGLMMPKWSPEHHDDAEPLGVGGKDIAMTVTRLKVLRDVYYTSTTDQRFIQNEAGSQFNLERIEQIQHTPSRWGTKEAKALFTFEKGRQSPMFSLQQGQFLPMGDNSPASLDGRVWDGPHFVGQENLIGRAMFIYWPHSLNKPIKYFPNFAKMGFIH